MSLSKLYYCQANSVADDIASVLGLKRSFAFAIKAFLLQHKTGTTGTSGAPPAGAAWTVYQTCDSVTAGVAGDAVDHLGGATYTAGKWVGASPGSVHSWFVLRSPIGICAQLPSDYFYLTVDLQSATAGQLPLIALSKVAPTGGTTTARPTSAAEVEFSALQMADQTVTTHRFNFVTDAKGNFYIAMCRSAAGIAHSFTGVLQAASPGLAAADVWPMTLIHENLSTGRGAMSGTPWSSAAGYDGTQGLMQRSPTNSEGPGTSTGCGFITPINATFLTRTHVNQASSLQDALPCIVNFVGAASGGIRGTVPDWFMSNSARAVGSCEPATGATEHALYGYFWVPNGGVAPTL